jgi:hypothetical protein
MSKEPPFLTSRGVAIYKALLWRRRIHCKDNDFFRAIDYWDKWYGSDKIRTYRSTDDEIGRPGVVAFAGNVCLTADERRIELARKGCAFSNTLIGHEVSHVALNHHKFTTKVANFDLAKSSYGYAIIPKNQKEKEADFGAIVLLCGVALADKRLGALDLARRACADVGLVVKAQKFVQLDVFQRELSRPNPDLDPRIL